MPRLQTLCGHYQARVPCKLHQIISPRPRTLRKSSCQAHPQSNWRILAVRATQRETGQSNVTFTQEDAKAARMLNFRREFQLTEGRVIIQALSIPLIDQTAELLAASFVASLTRLVPYASYVRRNIIRYLREHQAMAPDALVLVAVLQPSGTLPTSQLALETAVAEEQVETEATGTGPVTASGADGVSAGGASSVYESPVATSTLSGTRLRVIGSAEVSFKSSTRSSQPFLDAPERCCYLCNMAVSPVFRRRGVATRLLAAAEELAADVMNESEMYLHLRFVDKEAAALYQRAGFLAQAQHWSIAPLFGIQRMKLMRKHLQG